LETNGSLMTEEKKKGKKGVILASTRNLKRRKKKKRTGLHAYPQRGGGRERQFRGTAAARVDQGKKVRVVLELFPTFQQRTEEGGNRAGKLDPFGTNLKTPTLAAPKTALQISNNRR